MAIYHAPKGTKDVLPQESYRWQYIENIIRGIVQKYGLLEARTPVIEHTELFLRGVGQTTDVVQKEMYTFLDKGGRSITLKPEGTAGAVRMFIENGLFSEPQPTKLFYLYCPVFRYERPQAGRLREHHQFGVEIFGAKDASADAETIAIAAELFDTIGIEDLRVRLNSIGCPKCRGEYQKALKDYYSEHLKELCPTCLERFEKNPLRLLDCKEARCQEIAKNAPHTMDFICEECREHMEKLEGYLELMHIDYELDPMLVRGLDYYTKTVFEIVTDMPGVQGTLCGGGRYDGLIKELGGPDMPAVGFGLGMERLLLMMEESEQPPRYEIFLISMDEESKKAAFELCFRLRNRGVKAECDHMGRSLKAQMKYASKMETEYCIVIGKNEIESGRAMLKYMLAMNEDEPIELNPDAIIERIR
ncbi:MAG: histidine--tRNA ligase [Clostridia bacterium]|nr:histidine--tRNA ligase [Clostridia bacterium]